MNAAVRFADTFGQVARFVEMALAGQPPGDVVSIDIGGSFFDCVASDAAESLKSTLVRSPSLLSYRTRQWDRRPPVRPADVIDDPVLFGRTDGSMRIDDNHNMFKGYALCAGSAPTRSMDAWRRGRRPVSFINFGDSLLTLHQIEGATDVLTRDRPIVSLYLPDAPEQDLLRGALRDQGYDMIAISRLLETETESDELGFGCIAVPSEKFATILRRFHLENRMRKQGQIVSGRLLDRSAIPRQRQSSELFGLHAKSPPELHRRFGAADIAVRSNCYPVESDGGTSWRWLGPGAGARMAVPCSFPGAYNFEFVVMACRTPGGLSGCRAIVEGRESAVSVQGSDNGSVSFSGWLSPAEYKGYAEVDLINPGSVRQAGSDQRILRMNISSVQITPCV
ncbi:MAG TPA: hypothetical protein VHY79_18910 [Rhizomicrobium sp.]|jgi:hypothetical protein|nr:hypothetical protein [Rhizomicrobium sp.]